MQAVGIEIKDYLRDAGFTDMEGAQEEEKDALRPMTREELRAALMKFVVRRDQNGSEK
jgi:hypothetical protein